VAARGVARRRGARSLGPVGLTPPELVRRAFDIWATRDIDALGEIYHPEVIYDCSKRTLNPEVYEGYAGLVRLSEDVDVIWDTFDIELERLMEIGDGRVIALMRSSARGRSSGVEVVDTKAASIFTVRDGVIVHAELFPEREEAFAEAGIPHPGTE
jgi:ketosteroid isomerase-like protein